MAAASGKTAATIAGIAFGLALLVIYFTWFFDYRSAIAHVMGADRALLAAAVACFLAAIYVRCIKWTYVVRASAPMTWLAGIHIVQAANMANFLFPVRMGEIARLYLAKRVSGVPYATSVSATLIDRLSGLLTLMLVFSLYPLAGFVGVDLRKLWWAFGLVAGAAVVFLVFGERIAASLPILARRILPAAGMSEAGVARLLDSRPFAFATQMLANSQISRYGWRFTGVVFTLSILFVLGDALTFYLWLAAFGLPLGFVQAVVAATVLNLAFVLPSAPGQVGTAEMLPVIVFAYGFGLAQEVVASSALLWHLVSAAIILSMGAYSTWRLGARHMFRAES